MREFVSISEIYATGAGFQIKTNASKICSLRTNRFSLWKEGQIRNEFINGFFSFSINSEAYRIPFLDAAVSSGCHFN